MTDMMIQDPTDELDDLRSIGDDEQDDLRGLVEDSTDDAPVAESSDVSHVNTVDALEAEKKSSERLQETDDKITDESDATIESTDTEDDEAEIDAETPTETVVASTSSSQKVSVAPAPVVSPVSEAPKAAPVAAVEAPKVEKPVVEQATVTPVSAPKAEPQASSRDDDDYNPSLALKIFMIARVGFIKFFDVVLTLVAIIVERIAAVDWAGIFSSIADFFGMLNDMMKERVPQKFHMVVYAVIALLFFGLPIGFGAISLLSHGNNGAIVDNAQNMPISQTQSIVPDNGILSPLFTPTVQQWAEDIQRWTANTAITPDMFATVMQLESCGNPTVEGGLFGVGDANTTLQDTEAQAMTAIAKLQAALNASEGNFAMAMALYADGETVLSADFGTWSYHARDMYILGRNILNQANQGYNSSPDLNSWLANTGSVLCTEAQTTFNQ